MDMRLHLNKFVSVSQVTCCEFFLQCPSHERRSSWMRSQFVEQIIGSDAAAHDPLILRSLNRFSVSNHLALVRGDSFLDTTPAKEHTTTKEWKCRRGGPDSACEFIEYRLSESARRIPSLRSRCPIDESK